MGKIKNFMEEEMGTGWNILVLNPGIKEKTEEIETDTYVILLHWGVIDSLFFFPPKAAKRFLAMAKEKRLKMERGDGFVFIADEESRLELFLIQFRKWLGENL